jgi:DNA-binding transcriptional ArsR family regulator
MTIPRGYKGLRFPCECVSAVNDDYSDPWAQIAKRRLLPNGTKEEILNLVAEQPKTISQLAEALDMAPPSVYGHINDLTKSELLRESVEWEKKYPTERYYEPNFPVFKAAECAKFMSLCEEMAQQLAAVFERKLSKLERAFRKTNLAQDGWEFSDVTQCLYANMQRHARQILEERGILTPRQKHANGAKWIFWAQEPTAEK